MSEVAATENARQMAAVNIPAGVEVKLDGQLLTVKGKNGELSRTIHHSVEVKQDNGQFTFTPRLPVEKQIAFVRALPSKGV